MNQYTANINPSTMDNSKLYHLDNQYSTNINPLTMDDSKLHRLDNQCAANNSKLHPLNMNKYMMSANPPYIEKQNPLYSKLCHIDSTLFTPFDFLARTRFVQFGDFVTYDTRTEKTSFSQKVYAASEWILNCTGRTVYYISPSATKDKVTALEEEIPGSKTKQFFSSVGKIAFLALLTIGSKGIIPIAALIVKAIYRYNLGEIKIVTPFTPREKTENNMKRTDSK